MKNGELWLDDHGQHINAHGGCIMEHDGIWYWYGEHKIAGWDGRLAWVGVHVYSSTDLQHWMDRGIALPVTDDPESPICRGQRIERPKVVFCRQTGKFVMYFHSTDDKHTIAKCGVAVADDPTGPFTFLYAERPEKDVWPLNTSPWQQHPDRIAGCMPEDAPRNDVWRREIDKNPIQGRDLHKGQMARDMTLFVDDDGSAYHIYSSESNSTLHISRLTDDYLHHRGEYIRVFCNDWREAPMLFKHGREYCMVTSAATGWLPNAAWGSCAAEVMGRWWTFGNPFTGYDPVTMTGPETTFDCQGAVPFKVEDRQYVMLDRWNMKNFIDSRYIWLEVIFHEDGSYEIPWTEECRPL